MDSKDSYQRSNNESSDVSTFKEIIKPSSIKSFRTYGKLSYINTITCLEVDSDGADEASDESDGGTNEKPKKILTCRKILDSSPETEKKRKEAFEKWLKSKDDREKERKRVEQERLKTEAVKQFEMEKERKQKSEEKIQSWMQRKQDEAEKKMILHNMKKKAADAARKPKEFKKSINFQDWLSQKNDELAEFKKKQEKMKAQRKNDQKSRESDSSASFNKWAQSAPSKPKPVPLNRGLDSLKGSSSMIFVNPKAWESIVD